MIKISNKIAKIIIYVLLGYLFFSLILCLFVSWFYKPSNSPAFTSFNILFLIGAAILALAMLSVVQAKHKRKFIVSNKLFVVINVLAISVLVLYQLFLVYNVVFIPVTDIEDMTFGYFTFADVAKEYDENFAYLYDYFNFYTDRWFITGCFLRLYDIMSSIEFPNEFVGAVINNSSLSINQYMTFATIRIISVVCVDFSIVFAVIVVRKLTNNLVALLCLFLACFLCGTQLMATVPYSDTYSLFFIMLILFSYVCVSKRYWKWVIIFPASCFAFAIKPTAISILCAILLIEICLFFRKTHLKDFKLNNIMQKCKSKNFIVSALLTLITVLISIFVINSVSDFGIQKESEKNFTFTHFLMMGANPNTDGQFSKTDEAISAYQKNVEERENKNLEIWHERISQYGIVGCFELGVRKSMTNLGSGTFTSPIYDSAFIWDSQLSSFFASVYGINMAIEKNSQESNASASQNFDQGSTEQNIDVNNNVDNFSEQEQKIDDMTLNNALSQILWFFVLIGTIAYLYFQKTNKYTLAVITTLLIICIFLLIFESSPRYLYSYSLLFIIIACFGWKSFSRKFTNRAIKR